MRKLFFLLLVIGSITANAQDVSGTAKNAEGAGLAGATISIIKAKDSSVIKFGVSKENGSYSFTTVPAGEYRISASHVGYAPVITPAFTVGSANVTAPDVQLAKTSGGNLQGVVVTATKPMVEVKADKMIVNVEGTINAVGSDALELLRKSPGVQVDKDDNLSLSGKNGVQVYIDGRPTPLGGQDLANYLRSLQSANIESIELITNPSAKYEAAGNAGIINIR
ncbi:MAG: TonB-dependent receptor, partial [Bacteroidota bacterium]